MIGAFKSDLFEKQPQLLVDVIQKAMKQSKSTQL